jgi:hypothetical protein
LRHYHISEDDASVCGGEKWKSRASDEDQKMRKTMITALATALIAAFAVSAASASGVHQTKAERAKAAQVERARNANATISTVGSERNSDWVRGSAGSAPAGR